MGLTINYNVSYGSKTHFWHFPLFGAIRISRESHSSSMGRLAEDETDGENSGTLFPCTLRFFARARANVYYTHSVQDAVHTRTRAYLPWLIAQVCAILFFHTLHTNREWFFRLKRVSTKRERTRSSFPRKSFLLMQKFRNNFLDDTLVTVIGI